MAFNEIVRVNGEKHSAVLVIANRHTHFVEFCFLQTLDKFLAHNVFCQHDFEYIIIFIFYLRGQTMIVFGKLFCLRCLSYSFTHAAKVINFFQISKCLEEKHVNG